MNDAKSPCFNLLCMMPGSTIASLTIACLCFGVVCAPLCYSPPCREAKNELLMCVCNYTNFILYHHCTNSDVCTYILQILILTLYLYIWIHWDYTIVFSFRPLPCSLCIHFILISYFIFHTDIYRLFMRTRATFSTNRPSSVIEASEFCLFMWA